jgi:hypothetical protein
MKVSVGLAVAAPAAIVQVSGAPELLLPLAVAAVAVVAAGAAGVAEVVVVAATAPPGLAVQPVVVVHRREDPQSEVELRRQQPPQPD